MDLVRNQFPDGCDDHVGEYQHEGKGAAHTDGVGQRSTGGQGRTHTQQLDEQRVFLNDTFGQFMQHLDQSFPLA